jgi:hypothetical protein
MVAGGDPRSLEQLRKAIFRNDIEFVAQQIHDGIDVNGLVFGKLPLMLALAVASHPAGCYELGPDEALPRGTPRERLLRMVSLLLEAGADIGLKDGDDRPVIDAATDAELFLMIADLALSDAKGDTKKAAKRLQVPHKRFVEWIGKAKDHLVQYAAGSRRP